MTANTEWNIQSRAHACRECDCRFIDKQPCRTILSFQTEGYERIDLCEKCFQETTLPAAGVHSSWKGVYSEPPPKRKTARKEDVETLLRRLVEEQNPRDIPMIFVLAVMLERKRILLERAVHADPDGTRRYVYEHRKSGDTFVVVDPALQLDETDGLEEQVAARLARIGNAQSDEPQPAPGTLHENGL